MTPGTAPGTARVRDAAPADAAAVAGLEQRNLGIDAWSEGLVAEAVANRLPTLRVLVAEAEEQVVGFAVASIVAGTAELQRIAVDRAHRRSGLAGALLARVRELAVDGGADRLLLEVREDNAGAIAFYETQGFGEVGRRRRYYKDGATAVVLALGLPRTELA
ncbi:ribosomal protein S18-alanine N-acetyltransferase [Nocardioides panaciterrulae]|uniref:Ribosomal-protein-alanine N-acetyltransferase n=1 Tax=Nocardioides panaciterrulae TaxID=661492 RepID=A0A7Y9E3W1_9ACTN|nr:ribosomal protein S18-alanine N-acetyltransferase [Nocardioides panaciterrulae]NYD40758.1 ribosomal-protein-alanine N-acetyltransferase [Nocardioides panaciterrulae]